MPRAVTPIRNEEPAPNRKRWTRKECKFLVENGLLTGRYELVEGEIISKMGQKRPHIIAISRLAAWPTHTFGEFNFQVQGPIDIADDTAAPENETNEPEPDGAASSEFCRRVHQPQSRAF